MRTFSRPIRPPFTASRGCVLSAVLGVLGLIVLVAAGAGAEQIRFNVAPGPFEQATIQGYDFVKSGDPSMVLGIEPFGALCPDGSGCPSGGSTYYLGVAPPLGQQGVSLYPTYPSAWAPFQVTSLALAHAPGYPDVSVTLQAFDHPGGGLLPDDTWSAVVTDTFQVFPLPAGWTSLGELRVLTNGSPAVPLFIDDIEGTLAEPAPPDDSVPEENDCATFTYGPSISTWPIENLGSVRVTEYDDTNCYYVDLGDGLLEEVCDRYDDVTEASETLGAFEGALSSSLPSGRAVTQSSMVGCGDLGATGSAAHPPALYVLPVLGSEYWRSFWSRTRYLIAFDVVASARLSIDGTLSSSDGIAPQDALAVRVRRTDGGGTLVYERLGPLVAGVEVLGDELLLEPGSYEIEALLAFSADDETAGFDVAFDFAAIDATVPATGGVGACIVAAGLAGIAWRRLRLVQR